MIRLFGKILLSIGIIMLIVSSSFNQYTDEKAFYEARDKLIYENKGESYSDLWHSYLSPKITLIDYGLTFCILSIFILILIPRDWKKFKSPDSKNTIILIGLFAVFLTIFGFVGELFLDAGRDYFPPGADSIGIPLMSVPILTFIFVVWYLINLIRLIKPFRTGVVITDANLTLVNYWFLGLIIITTFIVIFFILIGGFCWISAGLMWIYFYTSLLLGKSKKEKLMPTKAKVNLAGSRNLLSLLIFS